MFPGCVDLLVSWAAIVESAANAFEPVRHDCLALPGTAGNDGTTVYSRSDVFRKLPGGNGDYLRIVILRIVHRGTAVFDFMSEPVAYVFD